MAEMLKTLLEPVWSFLRELGLHLVRGWPRFWFTPVDATPLALIRICTALVVFTTHLLTITQFQDYVGPHGWVDAQAIRDLRNADTYKDHPMVVDADLAASFERSSQSIWFYVQDPTAIWVIHGFFMLAVLCMIVGLYSRTTSIITWLGHLSFIHRGHALWYGMDTMLAFLLLYLAIAPSGQTLSLDRWRQRRRMHLPANTPAPPSVAANFAIRLIQVHLCIVYICSGLAKLQGNLWWNGRAIYFTLLDSSFSPIDMRWLPRMAPDWVLELISSLGVAFTLFYEIGFTFLVWNRLWRPVMLFLGVVMHVGISLSMGLGSFQVTMMVALIAFVKPESARWFVDTILRRTSTEPKKAEFREGLEKHPRMATVLARPKEAKA